MSKSKIEWTEVTWNPVTGCTKISQGCKNCYAETIANRFWTNQIFEEKLPTGSLVRRGRKFTDVICHEDRLEQPLHWKKPRMIFVNSMSDLFHEDVPFEFIDKIFDVMVTTPRHTYQILTKRAERMLEWCEYQRRKMFELGFDGFIIPDFIWLGVSVENQEQADKRIPLLLQTPARVKWISAEPLLENITIYPIENKFNGLCWVVCGGESGKNKRPFELHWAKCLRNECEFLSIPFFMKQVDKVQPIPEDLFIREYPLSKEQK